MRRNLIFYSCYLFLLLGPLDLFARAGGGGGGGGGGGIVGLILLPFFLLYIGILHYYLRKKNKEARALIDRLERVDADWGFSELKDRIHEVFLKVQDAWMARDQTLAEDCMSEALFRRHKRMTDRMIKYGRVNIMEDIHLLDAKVVEIADYDDDQKDHFWAWIEASMIDYTIDEESGKIIKNSKKENETFTELWRFIRSYEGIWVLDRIDSEVEIADLKSMYSFVEPFERRGVKRFEFTIED